MDRKERNANKQTNRKLNPWKWAFLGLLALVIGTVIWFLSQLSPTVIGQPSLVPQSNSEEIQFQIQAEKEDINQLVAEYIDEEVQGENVDYQFQLQEVAVFNGTFTVFGFDVPFALYLEPFVMENGNLQLRAQRLSVGRLNMPIAFAMNQMGNQLSVPEWVAINSDEETIVLNLDQFTLENGMHFTVEAMDLEEDNIRMNVYIPPGRNQNEE